MKDLPVFICQEVFHRHLQQPGQGKQVIHCRQALSMLPLINGLRVFKPKVGLKIPHGHAGFAAVPLDAAAGLSQVNDRKCILCIHQNTLLSGIPSFYMAVVTFRC